MKKAPVLFTLFLYSALLASQTTDTTFISISQEDRPMEKQRFVDPYHLLFSTLEPTRWLFTLNLTALSGDSEESARVGAEVKLFSGVSLQGTYGIGAVYSPTASSLNGTRLVSQRFGLMSRWYYAMPGRIRNGTGANNMSGNYISMEAVYAQVNGRHYIASARKSLVLGYGIQRRLFRYGFFDIRFGVGILKDKYAENPTNTDNKWSVFANSQIGLGFALAQPNPPATKGGYCDVLRCFREDRQMWKLDLYKLFRFNDLENYNAQVALGYERKIGDSPYSLEVQGLWATEYGTDFSTPGNAADFKVNKSTYGAAIQPRYYFTQKERIAKGKGGNNLSGTYVGTQIQWSETRTHQQGIRCDSLGACLPVNEKIFMQNKGFGALFGLQHRLFQHGFVDFSMRLTFDWVNAKTKDFLDGHTTKAPYAIEYNTTFNLRAGLAF